MGNRISDTGTPLFYSKILLFGEYSVIFDSMALSVPFSRFNAGFRFLNSNRYPDNDFAVRSNAMLSEYCLWLQIANREGQLKGHFDTDAFIRDIEAGIFLESNIPQGYGLGSSGALCAAVYDRYANSRIDYGPAAGYHEMRELKKIFASMESWFHGTSSGLDPLNCYLRRPVLVGPHEKISIVVIPGEGGKEGADIFLIDTGRAGKTGPLVRLFVEKAGEQSFMELVRDTMIPSVNNCIGSMLNPDMTAFMSDLKRLSEFQLIHMKEMIPCDFTGLWETGLGTDDFYLKLCGSGGGGYLLGFTGNFEKANSTLAKLGVDFIPVYIKNCGQGLKSR